MSSVALVTDSTSYIPSDLLEKYQISVAPQVLIWGEETFRDGVDIQPDEFYTRLKKAKVMPSTSQATIRDFKETYTRLLADGHEILNVLIGSKLSGTIISAMQAKEMFPGACIEIVDSGTTAMATGFQVLMAARAAEQGANLLECKRIAEEASRNVGHFFAVDTLEFLHRGGRIGGATRFLGTALNIKPILELINGQVEPIERVRTRKKSLQRLIELAEAGIGDRKPVHLAVLHANAPEDAGALIEEANSRIEAVETVFSTVSPVVGTHAGPGTVGLAYLAGM